MKSRTAEQTGMEGTRGKQVMGKTHFDSCSLRRMERSSGNSLEVPGVALEAKEDSLWTC